MNGLNGPYRMAGPDRRLGIYGFGTAAHIISPVDEPPRRALDHAIAIARWFESTVTGDLAAPRRI
jgi:hypothetical protein